MKEPIIDRKRATERDGKRKKTRERERERELYCGIGKMYVLNKRN